MMSGFFSVLSAAALLLSVLALFFAVRTAALVRELQRAQPDLRASRLKSLETSLEDLSETVTALANRVKMMRVRTAVNHVPDSKQPATGFPDPYTDPDRWRAAMNSRIAQGRHQLPKN